MSRLSKCAPLLLLALAACQTSLRTWVEDRGYTFDSDYSTKNPLGYRIGPANRPVRLEGFEAIASPRWSVGEVREVFSFRLDTKADIEKILAKANLPVTGRLDLVSKAEIELKGAFRQELLCLHPTWAVTGDSRVTLVTEVLNAGRMRIKLLDKGGINITASVLGAHAKLSWDRDYVETGEGLYVGYRVVPKSITALESAKVALPAGTGLCVLAVNTCFEYVKFGRLGTEAVAEVLINPMSIPDKTLEELHREGERADAALPKSAPFTRIHRKRIEQFLRDRDKAPADPCRSSGPRIVRAGDRFGLRAGAEEHLFVEVESISPEKTILRVQRIRMKETPAIPSQ